ncbi:MAG: hypothetical protein H6953_14765 [Chromatiaceae bacterium]|nr:hypothetical protein [Gammaproteobacteria bacterium]MCP5306703.1 hypothetical protein [Chromatiaceae bacterium]MCP5421795.1 hypothetical protein [Chromatiaceae bacterium]
MLVEGNRSLSLLGRSAVVTPSQSRASDRQQLDPVDPTDPLKDPTSTEYRELESLKKRDREVRQHEQAHIAAGGAYVGGGATFTYETGPDGRRYAVGGEVSIDTSDVAGDPAATIRKMRAIRSAASAPAEPSAQDRSVAAQAARAEAEAHIELREQQGDEEVAPDSRVRDALASYRDVDRAEDAAQVAPVLDLIA